MFLFVLPAVISGPFVAVHLALESNRPSTKYVMFFSIIHTLNQSLFPSAVHIYDILLNVEVDQTAGSSVLLVKKYYKG